MRHVIRPMRVTGRTFKQIVSDFEGHHPWAFLGYSGYTLIHHEDCKCDNCYEVNVQRRLDAMLSKLAIGSVA